MIVINPNEWVFSRVINFEVYRKYMWLITGSDELLDLFPVNFYMGDPKNLACACVDFKLKTILITFEMHALEARATNEDIFKNLNEYLGCFKDIPDDTEILNLIIDSTCGVIVYDLTKKRIVKGSWRRAFNDIQNKSYFSETCVFQGVDGDLYKCYTMRDLHIAAMIASSSMYLINTEYTTPYGRLLYVKLMLKWNKLTSSQETEIARETMIRPQAQPVYTNAHYSRLMKLAQKKGIILKEPEDTSNSYTMMMSAIIEGAKLPKEYHTVDLDIPIKGVTKAEVEDHILILHVTEEHENFDEVFENIDGDGVTIISPRGTSTIIMDMEGEDDDDIPQEM